MHFAGRKYHVVLFTDIDYLCIGTDMGIIHPLSSQWASPWHMVHTGTVVSRTFMEITTGWIWQPPQMGIKFYVHIRLYLISDRCTNPLEGRSHLGLSPELPFVYLNTLGCPSAQGTWVRCGLDGVFVYTSLDDILATSKEVACFLF